MSKELDGWSLRVTPLIMRCNGHVLGSATGFFWRDESERFLVTNWHVLAGRHPKTMKALHKDCAVPDEIEYVQFIADETYEENYEEVVRTRVRLEGDHGNPVWLEHPVHGSKVDVAAIQIPPGTLIETPHGKRYTRIYPINGDITTLVEILRQVPPWRAIRREMGDDMFVLGFPLGLTPTGHFPIWKRASVASEMDVLLDGRPAFLIDTATREGMSGSPVIHRTFEIAQTPTGFLKPKLVDAFVGVYSGRHIGDLNEEAQFGIVWREELIREIIAVRTPGRVDLSGLP